jgi:glutamyl-tRNA synthetase
VSAVEQQVVSYCGRIAPTPTGLLHLGHARTFWVAQERARDRHGAVVLRVDDLDQARCRQEYVDAMYEDLAWFGIGWDRGPDIGGGRGPFAQSARLNLYRDVFETLKERGVLYPCNQSRKDILRSLTAPHSGDEEPLYPGTCRPGSPGALTSNGEPSNSEDRINWRFQVRQNQVVEFMDGFQGKQEFVGGKDFGDFIVWRHDGFPAYHLATTVDEAQMGITEVVRGEDLMTSTARQILLFEALGWKVPDYFHCPLMCDASGVRLAKRNRALSLRELRASGRSPLDLRAQWGESLLRGL